MKKLAIISILFAAANCFGNKIDNDAYKELEMGCIQFTGIRIITRLSIKALNSGKEDIAKYVAFIASLSKI